MNYKIAMDSSSNMLSMDGTAFKSVPLKIIAGEKEFIDDEHLDIDVMLKYLSSYKGRSGTSCPNIGEWIEAFGDAEGVFVPTITSNLSGSYASAVQAKDMYEETHPGRRVCCLDSLSTGPEMVLIAEKLGELIAESLDFDTIETRIRDYMKHTHLLFSLESLNNMARNGRVSPIVAKACGLLGIRIVGKASDEGTLQPLHKARGEGKAVTKLYDELKKNYHGGKVRVAHCHNERAAEIFVGLLKSDFPNCDVSVGPTTALCSFYAEVGGLMIGFEDTAVTE